MLPKQTDYKVGMYLRPSRDDERVGDSLSIENQRRILTNYISNRAGNSTIHTLMTEFQVLHSTDQEYSVCLTMRKREKSIL